MKNNRPSSYRSSGLIPELFDFACADLRVASRA